jgi:hypothetical protein
LEVAQDVSCALLHPGQLVVELVVAGVVVTYQHPVPAVEDAQVLDLLRGPGGDGLVPDQPLVGGAHRDHMR